MKANMFILSLFITGCTGGSFDKRPGQDKATEIVWNQLYGEDRSPPEVEWFTEPLYTYRNGGGCYGITLIGWKVQVTIGDCIEYTDAGMTPFDCSIANSAFSHELMHYHTFLRTGDVDAAHWRGDWHLADDIAPAVLIQNQL